MTWFRREYILKGIFLGLLLLFALQEPSWWAVAWFAGCTFAGLAAALTISAVVKIRQGYRVRGRWPAFLLFLLLESPDLVYAGILLGTAFGAFAVRSPDQDHLLGATVGGGALLGLAFAALRTVRRRDFRLYLGLALAAVLVGGLFYAAGEMGGERRFVLQDPTLFGVQLLLGIPVFYLLTFTGHEEETEVEIAAMCAALGVALGMLTRDVPALQSGLFFVCILIYFFYTTRVLKTLRVFKHALRGMSYARIGRYREALLAFRRALELDPANSLAKEGFWGLHRTLDPLRLTNEPETLQLIDFDLCVQRISTLLMEAPDPEKLQESLRLLDLIVSQRPLYKPVVQYWRAVAHTHAREYELAVGELGQLLDPEKYAANDPQRMSVLYRGWHLALYGPTGISERLGPHLLDFAGRRLEAIAAVEHHLATNPEDADAWKLKRLLYGHLTEAAFEEAVTSGRAGLFDHAYAEQLGLALLPDAAEWERGAAFLRMASRGSPERAVLHFARIAEACERVGKGIAARDNYERAKQAGQQVGPAKLGAEERQTYFAVVERLAQGYQAGGDHQKAIENWELFSESERSGLETLRTLAQLYEQAGNPLAALRQTERALLYNGKDKDLLERKDRYYYSVLPDHLRTHADAVRSWFDTAYCLRKARSLLDVKDAELDLIEWAEHLLQHVAVLQPENRMAKVLLARCRLRLGARDEAIKLLEEARNPKPERFAGAEDEEAWFLSSRLLGEMYLFDLGRPEDAAACFNDYRKSPKSGADTLFKLGQAYEQLGDHKKAAHFYEHVTAYEGHPLSYEAQDAISRLKNSAG